MLPDVSRMESQHNVVLRNTGFDQVTRNPLLCAIALNPQFAIDDVNMDEAAVDPFVVFPPYCHEHVTIRLAVKDCLRLQASVGIWDLRVFGQHVLHDLAIGV